MSSIIILAIIFIAYGVFILQDEQEKNKNGKPTNERDGDLLVDSSVSDVITPTPIKPIAKRAARKVIAKRSLQPSPKRVVAPAKKRVTKKVGVKKVTKK